MYHARADAANYSVDVRMSNELFTRGLEVDWRVCREV